MERGSGRRLSTKESYRFLKYYKQHEVLWNVDHKNHRNRRVRESCYRDIAIKMEIPEFKVEDVKRKIASIRAQYRTESTKVINALRSGMSPDNLYQNKLPWYRLADSFLQKRLFVMAEREESDNLKDDIDSMTAVSSRTPLKTAPNPPGAATGTSARFSPEDENDDGDDDFIWLEEQTEEEDNCFSTSQVRHNSPSDEDRWNIGENFPHRKDSSLPNMKKVASMYACGPTATLDDLKNKASDREDEFSLFGQNVAAQLRSLPLLSALDCQIEIMKLLHYRRAREPLTRSKGSSSVVVGCDNKFENVQKSDNLLKRGISHEEYGKSTASNENCLEDPLANSEK